ncbi:pre-mRNA-processing factor 17 [Sphaeroforma arctica JP610]|uniref:Pre-mRNA-processing factor 17 n=1 Tax=Sphaeroforma arctica JP610 TaxID=667725 RepID=A0A0L0FSH9_9EUKA|nr:pre-mRNA-processing factor 17 [Sphaeroforma arctica JP610]KNC79700.1 pre-mRNA-processing factor 17 [Sphaeroforma arctica JP610]|eukprot:XP_014153602.1 pre-mRNA-processing factor 17 [Sphaeroforma arctica JP610]
MNALADYAGSSSESDGEGRATKPTKTEERSPPSTHVPTNLSALKKKMQLNVAPLVHAKTNGRSIVPVDPHAKNLGYNPRIDEMYGPIEGPTNPNKTSQEAAERNIISGYVEDTGISDFAFEEQRRTFHAYGYASNPSAGANVVGDRKRAEKQQNATAFEGVRNSGPKRKREHRGDAADLDNYQGPWAKWKDEKTTAKPTDEQMEILKSYKVKNIAESGGKAKKDEEVSVLNIDDAQDYQGRTFMDIPRTVPSGVKLDSDDGPEKCYVPTKNLATWQAHDKGVSAIRLFPRSGHLILTAGMDCRVKLWEYYGKRRLIRTYVGHTMAVRDIDFNNDGTRFLTASYDRMVKMWDTFTGECLGRYTNGKIPYCVKFNPDPAKQHMIVAGTSDKKIVQWDTTTGEVVQEYDRHLGAVNTITFIDGGNRMVSTSDDKSIKLWEWEIPVDYKHIAEPGMHSVPAVAMHPKGRWMAFQSLDNTILIYGVGERFRINSKKQFKGHLIAGYAVQPGFSSDGRYVISGDSEGKLIIWDWKSTKIYKRLECHTKVTIGCLWHPHEPSQVITCSWDGTVSVWD